MLTARAGLHSPERHAFTRRDIRNLAPEVAAARPNFDVFRKSVHRNQMRKGTFDLRDQNVFAAGRRRDAGKDRRPTDRRLLSGCDIDRRKLTSEIVCKQIFVVRGLDHIFERRRGRGLSVVLLHVRPGRHGRFRRRRPAARRHQFTNQSHIVVQPIAWIAGCRVKPVSAADHLSFARRDLGDP